MSESSRSFTDEQLNQAHGLVMQLKDSLSQELLGQPAAITDTLVALLAGGHVLVEGVPGLGKTLLVRCLAECLGGEYKRVQFTPDLMPSDITGHSIYDLKSEHFEFRKGPVFTNFLLADEINRAPAKTQAALLEAMQEHQVTVDGACFTIEAPFMVLATQNPIEQEGTYPLPEAEIDRFMMKVLIDYPEQADEVELVMAVTGGQVKRSSAEPSSKVRLSKKNLLSLQHLVTCIEVDRLVMEYCVSIVRATRSSLGIVHGAGPRGSISLIKAAKARALMAGRGYVVPDDVKDSVLSVLRHRITLSADFEIEGFSNDDVLLRLLDDIDAPRL
ncbi:MAG: AAA family ATPase [Gammaproteobacteria bacterium]|nr:MAG: AAA family ATPase [Gammaproteobacteria bacterium]